MKTGREPGSKTNQSDKRWWEMTRFEWIMSVLTLAGLVIAVFTGLIFLKQLHEMRTDQRAWISFTAGATLFPKDAVSLNTVQVTTPITVNNIGKTAARLVKTDLVMEYDVNGSAPDFVYDQRARQVSTTGIVFPNSPFALNVPFTRGTLNSAETSPRFLTQAEFHDLQDGDGYMVIYGQATYVDIFGTKHWTHFCTFFSAPGVTVKVTARACTDYNDTDGD
jgi:hypothetical protein